VAVELVACIPVLYLCLPTRLPLPTWLPFATTCVGVVGYVWRCMGRDNRILEYDPDYAKHEMKHREYLQSPGLFKQAVPITHQPTLAKIHLNFRLTYLKDVVGRVYLVLPISNMCYILSHHPPRQGATLLLAAFALCAGACVQVHVCSCSLWWSVGGENKGVKQAPRWLH